MTLENDFLRVDLSPSTGGFVSLFDKRSQRDFLDKPTDPMLFRLMLPDGHRLYSHCDSRDVCMAFEAGAADLRYSLDTLDTKVHLALDETGILATLRIANHGPFTIEEVQFPWIIGLKRVPDDSIVMPCFGQRIVRDPLGEGIGGDHRHAEEYLKKIITRYPERMVSAWCDYGNREGGIALEGRHTDFSIMDFFIHKGIRKFENGVHRSLNLGIVHPVRIRPGETWHSSPVRVSVHKGDWHATADAHRAWVETWIRKPDRPQKFSESVGWHYFFMKHQDGYARFTYADLPRMAQAALSAGCRYLLVFGWQQAGHDNRYPYGYIPNAEWGGVTALRENLRIVHEMGVEVIPFFNGTLANTQCPEHKEYGYRWEALTREGAPYYAGDWAGFNFDSPTSTRGRMHHELCPCDEHRSYFLETARRIIQDYGFGNLQLDQISLKMAPCYNSTHAHSRPDRAYVDGLHELLPKVRALLRSTNPEGIALGEGTNEFVGQWCDGAWTWDFLLDPEPILYSVPWLLTSTAVDALEPAEVNRAFVHKIHLDIRIGGGDECVDEYPSFAEHIRRLSDLRRRTAQYYALADFRDQEGIRHFRGPGVLAKVFHHRAAAKIGIVLAETQGKAATVRLTSDWLTPRTSMSIESALGSTCKNERSGKRVKLELQPYETAILCIDHVGQDAKRYRRSVKRDNHG